MHRETDKMMEVPDDVLHEVLEAERELFAAQRRYRKKPYPTNNDIIDAIREALKRGYGMHPDDFPYQVLEVLELRGFEVRHVTIKRIWRLYETLVRKGVIPDYLGVVVREE